MVVGVADECTVVAAAAVAAVVGVGTAVVSGYCIADVGGSDYATVDYNSVITVVEKCLIGVVGGFDTSVVVVAAVVGGGDMGHQTGQCLPRPTWDPQMRSL